MSQKALLLRLSAMGDVVIAAAAVQLLHHHGIEVHLVTRQPFDQLFECDERVSSVITLSRRPSRPEILNLIKKIRRERFDFVFDLHKKVLTTAILLMSGGRKKFQYPKRIIARRTAVWFHRKIPFIPVAELYQRPIRKALNIKDDEFFSPQLKPCDEPIAGLPDGYIVLAPGAGYETRVWPHFVELCRKIRGEGLPVVIVGASGDRWARLTAEKCSSLSDPQIIDLVGKTDLRSLVALIGRARGFVGNDSGPMHIADALNVPLVGIFGPTIPEFGFKPLGEKSRVLELSMNCRPCSLHGEKTCRYGDKPCLANIAADDVFRALMSLI